MIPKSGKSPADSRKSVGIHEFAALARSSLNGISQAVRDHVTKPTSLAQGRVAHLIEWKGWPKPAAPPPGAQSHFNSYCHLTEGEKEARFAAGVAEQFAIAEAKLRAWASLDDDDEEEDIFNDEDIHPNGQTQSLTSQSSDAATSDHIDGEPCQPDSQGSEPPTSNSTMVSTGNGVCDRRPGPNNLHPFPTGSAASPGDCMAPFLEEEEERLEAMEEQMAPLEEEQSEVCIHNKPEWRPRARSSRYDSCYSTSHSESPGEEDEEDEEEEGNVFHEVRVWHCSPRGFFSDRASSGVASFDEEEEREDMEEEKKEEKEYLM